MHSNGVVVLGFFLLVSTIPIYTWCNTPTKPPGPTPPTKRKKIANQPLMLQYTFLLVYLRSACWRDPTSVFYRVHSAHSPEYSTYRIQQAAEYVESMSDYSVDRELQRQRVRPNPPELCIGIPTVQRRGISYLKSTLGSLQHGLTPEERDVLYFVVFVAHANQSNHNEYNQPWLVAMADELPSYHNVALAQTMSNQSHEVKSKYDYSIVLEACANTGAPYAMMLEDDVVFLDGWWPRVARALELATIKTWESGYTDCKYQSCSIHTWVETSYSCVSKSLS